MKNILLIVLLAITGCGLKTEGYTRYCNDSQMCQVGTYCAELNGVISCPSCLTAPNGKCDDSDCALKNNDIVVCSGLSYSCQNSIPVSSDICVSKSYCKDNFKCTEYVDAGETD